MRKQDKFYVWAILLAAQAMLPAFAALADTAYFNLWTRASANRAPGGDDRLVLCKRGNPTLCRGGVEATTDNTIDRNNAIFKALKKTAGKGSGAGDPFKGKKASTKRKSIANRNASRGRIKLHDMLIDDNRYYTFMLDLNERGGIRSQLRLDELQFFIGGADPLDGFPDGMAGRLHNWLFTTAAAGFGDNAYVYLYNFDGDAYGDEDLGEAQAREELAAVTNLPLVDLPSQTGVPEPGTAMLMVAGLIGLVRKGRATS